MQTSIFFLFRSTCKTSGFALMLGFQKALFLDVLNTDFLVRLFMCSLLVLLASLVTRGAAPFETCDVLLMRPFCNFDVSAIHSLSPAE